MSLINRNITRTIKNVTEVTSLTQSINSDTVDFALSTSDKFYLGFQKRFTTRYFDFGVLNATQVSVSVKYWDGAAFVAVQDLVDQTDGFTKSGFLSWQVESNQWEKVSQSPIVDKELYWIEITVGADLDAGTTLQSVLNLFTDDEAVRRYYPELITDSRYLPTGRTNFLEQHLAAKDLVVQRLRADHLIKDEGAILDVNQVDIAAIHAFAWVVLNPIARDEGDRLAADTAREDMDRELDRVKLDLDLDESGEIEEAEEAKGNYFLSRR